MPDTYDVRTNRDGIWVAEAYGLSDREAVKEAARQAGLAPRTIRRHMAGKVKTWDSRVGDDYVFPVKGRPGEGVWMERRPAP